MAKATPMVIKQRGQRPSEQFDAVKLQASIEAACLSVRAPQGAACDIATGVCDQVSSWAANKPAVTSHDIRRIASQALAVFHDDAAYLYQHHQLVV